MRNCPIRSQVVVYDAQQASGFAPGHIARTVPAGVRFLGRAQTRCHSRRGREPDGVESLTQVGQHDQGAASPRGRNPQKGQVKLGKNVGILRGRGPPLVAPGEGLTASRQMIRTTYSETGPTRRRYEYKQAPTPQGLARVKAPGEAPNRSTTSLDGRRTTGSKGLEATTGRRRRRLSLDTQRGAGTSHPGPTESLRH